jgi:ATP-dependent Lhr-like helicase
LTGSVGTHIEYLDLPASVDGALAGLSAPVQRWFCATFGDPTLAQRFAWPALAAGKNLLLAAPTGSGKTLAAFLPILDRLIKEHRPGPGRVCSQATYPAGPPGVRSLYVAPLKALAGDVRRNLRRYLRGLGETLAPGTGLPRIGVRTGDTRERVRRAHNRQPPEILLTTPESLAVLLSQPESQRLFAHVRSVVVDELHALAGNKRGADLSLSLERLAAQAQAPIQRIGLSATCTPLAEAASFLAGWDRPCSVAQIDDDRPMELTLELLQNDGHFMPRLVDRLEPLLRTERTTLIFTNVRSLAERLRWALANRFPNWANEIGVHHSSLAAARRRQVERKLKQGRLRAVVASASLELGIDVGQVDVVVFIHPPGGVVRLLQRLGRSGHAPRRARRGLILTSTAADLFEAAVTAASGRAAQQESLRMARHPLDVLCQQLLGMAAQRPWTRDEAFALVKRATPYRDLTRADFDDCLSYLTGRDREDGPWLPSRLVWFGPEFTLADERTARLLRRNLGTILTEETRRVRAGEGANVGELDESFADSLKPGDRFLLDGRCLEFHKVEAGALVVEEVAGRPRVTSWAGEGWSLSLELARRLCVLREQAAEALRDGPMALACLLREEYGLDAQSIASLSDYFQGQECVSEMPTSRGCLIEEVPTEFGMGYYVHTPLHRPGNDALARLAVARLVRDRGVPATSLTADLGFAVLLARRTALDAQVWRRLFDCQDFEKDLDEAIAMSPALRERFRRAALTGFMLLRNPLGGVRKVGGNAYAEQRLFNQVQAHDGRFVLLRQARADVYAECCDAAAAQSFLRGLSKQTIRCRRLAQVSPIAEGWTHVTAGAAAALETPTQALEQLHARLMRA